MEHFQNDDLEYIADYNDVPDFEEDDSFSDNQSVKNDDMDFLDSDFEDDFEIVRAVSFSLLFVLLKLLSESCVRKCVFNFEGMILVWVFTEQVKD